VTKIGVIGIGNAGSATVMQLIDQTRADGYVFGGRNRNQAEAALADAASARPDIAQRASVGGLGDFAKCDIVVVTAGVQLPKGSPSKDILAENAKVMAEVIPDTLTHDVILIVIASPIDDILELLIQTERFNRARTIGFGGDLDTSRLRFVLGTEERGPSNVLPFCVGEHGARTIPVYDPEENYDRVRDDVRGFLIQITAQAGRPRNLATGEWLARLCKVLVDGRAEAFSVCSWSESMRVCYTRPQQISREHGLTEIPFEIPGSRAREELSKLLNSRRDNQEYIRKLALDAFWKWK